LEHWKIDHILILTRYLYAQRKINPNLRLCSVCGNTYANVDARCAFCMRGKNKFIIILKEGCYDSFENVIYDLEYF